MVRVAIVQSGCYVYDTPRTLEKLEKLTAEAKEKGAELILFPEAFVGGYPFSRNFEVPPNGNVPTEKGREEFKRYFNGAIEYDGPESNFIAEVAQKYGVHLVVGVIEKELTTMYCSVFFYGLNGAKLGKHRKLVPTCHERVYWGRGDASTMPVINTEVGKIGAIICWENYMPLVRTSMYKKGIQLYLAPCADDQDTWFTSMRHIAVEGRCFVISTCQFLLASHYPKDHPLYQDPEHDKVLMKGGGCIIDPMGKVLVAPDYTKELIAVADCDLSEIIAAKFDLDTVGHYSRPDIFLLIVNEKPQNTVAYEK